MSRPTWFHHARICEGPQRDAGGAISLPEPLGSNIVTVAIILENYLDNLLSQSSFDLLKKKYHFICYFIFCFIIIFL